MKGERKEGIFFTEMKREIRQWELERKEKIKQKESEKIAKKTFKIQNNEHFNLYHTLSIVHTGEGKYFRSGLGEQGGQG